MSVSGSDLDTVKPYGDRHQNTIAVGIGRNPQMDRRS